MDYPAAIAIAIPVSTFIVMIGTIVIKSMKRSNPGTQKVAVNSNVLKDFVRKPECDAISEGIANELKLTRESLLLAIKNLGTEIRSIKDGLN